MQTLTELLGKIATHIINPVIILGFTVATIFLFYSIFKMILHADDSKGLVDNRRAVIWGVVGMFIMFSVYGILRLVLATFNIKCEGVFFC